MKVSLIQMNSVSDKQANLAQARLLIEEAVRDERPDWICLPEVWDYIGGNRRTKMEAAETIPGGPAYTLMQELARTHRVFIHAGSILEKVEGDERIHNTTVAFDRDGKEVARYRKIHMFDITAPDGTAYRESAAFKPGDAVVTYDCEGVTVGCAICYDLRFPYLFSALVDKGAHLIALPSAFTMQTGKDHWEVLCRARAIETGCFVLAPAQTGFHAEAHGKGRRTHGHSLAVAPWGEVLADAGADPGVAFIDLDLSQVAEARGRVPSLSHDREFTGP